MFQTYLGLIQLGFLSVTAVRSGMSALFWVLGICVWAINVPYHVLSLDLNDKKSGGRIFKANITLGLYLTVVAVAELCTTRVFGWHNDTYKAVLGILGGESIKSS